jgi:hypothetical protein
MSNAFNVVYELIAPISSLASKKSSSIFLRCIFSGHLFSKSTIIIFLQSFMSE